MTEPVYCDKCGCPYDEQGGLVVGPADAVGRSGTLHLCNPCYEIIVEEILGDGADYFLRRGRAPKPTQTVSLGDAKHGAIVELVDGRRGRLQYIAKRSRLATVQIGTRHVKVPSDEILGVIKRGDE